MSQHLKGNSIGWHTSPASEFQLKFLRSQSRNMNFSNLELSQLTNIRQYTVIQKPSYTWHFLAHNTVFMIHTNPLIRSSVRHNIP